MFFDLVKVKLFVTRIRIHLDPGWFGFQDPDPYMDPHGDKNLDPDQQCGPKNTGYLKMLVKCCFLYVKEVPSFVKKAVLST